jgi:hypothetical protein
MLLKKVYWVVWCGDLYSNLAPARNILSEFKKILLKSVLGHVGFVVTYIPGDYLLVKKHFNKNAKFVRSLAYPGNLYKDAPESHVSDGISENRILVGNSGSPSNNHIRIFKRLKKNRKIGAIKVFCPLSYGDAEYISEICAAGYEYFGDDFVSLDKYMDIDEYVKFLSTIKYAVFDYDRQQGMGNIISLLGLGKGVFLNPETTPWDFFKEEGISVLDVNDLENFDLTQNFVSENPSKVRAKFSSSVLESQLYDVFD